MTLNHDRLFAKLKFVELHDLFDRNFIRKWIETKYWSDFDAFLTHLLVKMIGDPETLECLRNKLQTLDFFNSPFNLLCHMTSAHQHLPVDIFIDQLLQKTMVPTAVKPPNLYLKSQKGFDRFLNNLYLDIIFVDAKKPIFGEQSDEDRERNRAYLVYCYGALTLQIQDHFETESTNSQDKFQAIKKYLTNLLLMISKDDFEVAGNGECLTENDRIEFCKFHLLNLMIDFLLK